MKKIFLKLFTFLFIGVAVAQTGIFIFYNEAYTPSLAESQWKNPTDSLQVKIPFAKFSQPALCKDDTSKMCVPWIGEYIKGIYNYSLGIIGILSAVILMWGGFRWLTAGGSADSVSIAKKWITAAISGLIIALTSYIILFEINPDLVNMNPIKIQEISKIPEGYSASCIWKTVNSMSPSCDTGYGKAEDSACEAGKKPQTATSAGPSGYVAVPVCCCPTCKAGITCGKCDTCAAISDFGLICKEKPCLLNSDLAMKLAKIRESETNWQITEGWPPTVNHLDACHKMGTCADINFLNNSDDPTTVSRLYKLFVQAGLTAVYEHQNCDVYRKLGVNCHIYSTTTGHSFHVEI